MTFWYSFAITQSMFSMSGRSYPSYWNIDLKLEKSEFHVPEVSFLGFRVSKGSLQIDPGKIQAVLDWPRPTSIKQVQRFLGFSNFYRRFIRNVAEPLSAMTRKSAKPFMWTCRADQAFNKLKRLFTSAPILNLPDSELPFVLEVDASDVGVGAVLSQRSKSDKLHPCAFFFVSLHQRRGIMILETGSCWLLRWPWRSGGTGWRGPNTHS